MGGQSDVLLSCGDIALLRRPSSALSLPLRLHSRPPCAVPRTRPLNTGNRCPGQSRAPQRTWDERETNISVLSDRNLGVFVIAASPGATSSGGVGNQGRSGSECHRHLVSPEGKPIRQLGSSIAVLDLE